MSTAMYMDTSLLVWNMDTISCDSVANVYFAGQIQPKLSSPERIIVGGHEIVTKRYAISNILARYGDNCVPGFGGAQCLQPICFGILSGNASVCSGNGACTDPDTCICNGDFTKPDCKYPICDGLHGDAACNAGLNGTCVAPGNCTCLYGRNSFKDYCQTYQCFGYRENSCNNRGICVSTDSCKCDEGWGYSRNCSITQCFGVYSNDLARVCNGRGICTDFNTCKCADGFQGAQCEINGIAIGFVVSGLIGICAVLAAAGSIVVLIADLGLSKLLVQRIQGQTDDNVLVGTPGYIAPEVAMKIAGKAGSMSPIKLTPQEQRDLEKQRDVYSFGVIMLVLHTCELDLFALIERPMDPQGYLQHLVLTPDYRPATTKPLRMKNWYWSLLQDCWDTDPSKRPPFKDILTRLLKNVDDTGAPSKRNAIEVGMPVQSIEMRETV